MFSSEMPSVRPWRFLLFLLMLLATGATALQAQYFGRNNPQYRTFDFEVLRTEHFDVYFYEEGEQGARDAARMAERWYTRLSQILEHEFRQRQPLILYASHPDFQQTNILGSPVGEGTGGVTESLKQRVIMPLANTYAETDHVLGHELVHAFQYDISGLGRSAGSIDAGARAVATAPLWFIEGMAEYLTLGPVDPHTAMWLRDAAITGELPTLQQLAVDPRIFPYRYGHAIWAYITGRWGDAVVGQILRAVGEGANYQQAIQRILNVSLDELSADWHASVRRNYLPLLADWVEAREVATPLITMEQRGGRINVGPALSPDGQRLAFLSERGLLDVELWLADATTGEVIRRLVRGTALDAHYGSLNFIASAGSFSPDGQQLAFAALRRGRDVIAIVDVDRARVLREIEVPGAGELSNPAWSPDGQTLAISGTQGGITNLYLIDLETGEAEQLTTGRNADLMPAFSPDGTTLAFTTDRGAATDLEALHFVGYRIALLDLATREIQVLPTTQAGRNFNPVWAPDGQSIFFLSDQTGIANIYRLRLETGALAEVTRLFRGISGYTPLSPSLAGARDADRLVFSVFDAGGYNLYRMEGSEVLAGTPVEPPEPVAWSATPPAEAPPPAVLPPAPRPPEAAFLRVASYLAEPLMGLPSPELAAAWEVDPYRPRLSLDYVGQPQIGVSLGGAFGQGGLYGGIAGLWSDMLAWHTLFGAIQAQGQFDEIGFSTVYLYQRQRWDFGAAAQRIPFINAGRQQVLDQEANLFRDQILAFRTFDWRLQGIAQLPLSRVQRIEFTGGPRRLSRDVRIQEVVYDPIFGPGGELISIANPRFQESRQDIDDFNLVEGGAALVFDNALFGWTSPFAGQRYRFEVAPTVGNLQFVTGLADYRRYFWLQPFTLAGRAMHFGRWAMSAEDEATLGPIFLGQSQLIRGYQYNDLVNRCLADLQTSPDDGDGCAMLDHAFGQRLLLANLELRFPLVRALVLGPGLGVPPIEGFVFYDAGIAWDRATTPVFQTGVPADPGQRGILHSTGVGGRINLFGFAVLEVGYVRPLVGNLGWQWQFALQPGF